MPGGGNRAALTTAQRAKIIELCIGGMSRNQVAREVGVSRGTVSKVAHEAGHTFDRAAPKLATEAVVADARARKANMLDQQLLIQEAMQARLLATLQKRSKWPAMVKKTMGAQETRYLTYIPAEDFQKVQGGLASGMVIVNRIEQTLNPAAEEAGSLLDTVAADLGVADE